MVVKTNINNQLRKKEDQAPVAGRGLYSLDFGLHLYEKVFRPWTDQLGL